MAIIRKAENNFIQDMEKLKFSCMAHGKDQTVQLLWKKKLNIELPCARVPRCLYLCDSMDCITHQAPLSVEFSRQEYWSGLPFLTPGDLPSPGIEPMSLQSPVWASSTLTTAPPGKLLELSCVCMLSCFSRA